MNSRNRIAVSRLLKRLAATALAAATLIGNAAYLADTRSTPILMSVSADDVDDLRAEREEILARQEELEAQRNELAETLEEQEAEEARIREQIDLKIREINVNQELVDGIDAKLEAKTYEIALKQQAIAEKENEIADRFAELQVRLRALSKTGAVTSMLQMIISADGFTDYLLKQKAMQRISEENEALMNTLEAELQIINNDKAALELEKAKFEEERKPLIQAQEKLLLAKQELDVLYSEVNAITEKLNQDIDRYNASIAQADADAEALQIEINKAIAQNLNSGTYNQSGTMLWPAPSCNYISSTFKWRWGRQHSGLDICGSGCYGTSIVAAADGIVSAAGWMGGYGYAVMIDHGTSGGSNITTVYGHACEVYVSTGQAVYTGDVIAAIGSTGNSTGPHLHFEVRVDGTAVDPIGNGYVSTSGIIIDESL